jgi:putative pyoverdin transport system ATP-binding/permease protein
MKILSFLRRNSGGTVLLAAAAGVVSGACNTLMLALVGVGLSGGAGPGLLLALAFAALCVVAPLARIASELLLLRLGQKAVFDLRMTLSRRILAVPLRQLEELGAHRLTAALTDDVFAVTNAIIFVPLLCINLAVVVGCLVYLAWLSPLVFLTVLGFIVTGVISYQLPVAAAMRHLRLARDEEDSLFGHLRALVEGVKELKLHRRRREAFVSDVLRGTAEAYRGHNVRGMSVYTAATSWGQLLVFVVIGLVVFGLPRAQEVEAVTLTGYALAILYMMTPLQVIMNTLPNLARANVALNKLEEIGLSLTKHAEAGDATTEAEPRPPVGSLELAGVTHSYHLEGEENPFTLGPLDLKFEAGEIVFIVGGNGSGKTTLAKLLAGLYVPEGGEIRLDGLAVTDETRDLYRQNFSAVFSDFYLFESLLGLDGPRLEADAGSYLRRLQLSHKVRVEAGALSTTKLSQGQRKRLALLTAYLEDRPVYLFDEWAADQDPSFKEVFYLELLPELKARGKTVFVITHDDRYFFIGDRIIKLDYGQVEYDRPNDGARAPQAQLPLEAQAV